MAIYHCIGDSHTWQFIGKLPENLNNNNIENYKKKYNRIMKIIIKKIYFMDIDVVKMVHMLTILINEYL